VGITDSSVLSQLDEAFSAALFLSPTVPTIHTYQAQPFYLNLQPEAGGAVHREGDLHGYEEQGGSSDSHLGSHRRIQS